LVLYKKSFLAFLTLLVFTCFLSTKVQAQCVNGLVDPTDIIFPFEFTQQSAIYNTDFNGFTFTSYLETNLDYCGAAPGMGPLVDTCFQAALVNPTTLDDPYNYSDFGFSAATFLLFTEEAYFSSCGFNNPPVYLDADGDGFFLDAVDIPCGQSNPYNLETFTCEEADSTVYKVFMRFFCADDPSFPGSETQIICQEEIVDFTVFWSCPLEAEIDEVSPVLCNGDSTGTISVNVIEDTGTPPFTYLWYVDNPSGVIDIDSDGFNEVLYTIQGPTSDPNVLTDAPAGIYTLVMSDLNGCEYIVPDINIEIIEPPLLEIIDLESTDVSCNGFNDGSVSFNIIGGTPEYEILGDTVNLSAGTYLVSVIDANNCEAEIEFTIEEPQVLEVTDIIVTDASCNGFSDGSVELIIAGGTELYEIIGQTDNLSAGFYSVSVLDANGCSVDVEFTIDESDPIELLIETTDVSCNGFSDGSVEIIISGGTSPYTVLGATDNLLAGTYTIPIIDALNCTINAIFTIEEPEILEVSEVLITDVSCNGFSDGSVELVISGGTEPYTVIGDTTDLSAGIYSVTILDFNNCETELEFVIEEPDVLEIIDSVVTDASCNGFSDGSVELVISGGTEPYTTSQDTDSLSAGIYLIVVTDDNGCQDEIEFVIEEPESIEVLVETFAVSCNGDSDGSVELIISGGNGPYIIVGDTVNLSPGLNEVLIIDSLDCETSVDFFINEPELLQVVTETDSVSCNGLSDGSVEFIISGGTEPYEIFGQIDSLSAGSFSVLVVDDNDCQLNVEFDINEPDILEVSEVLIADVSCNGFSDGSVELVISGGTGPYTTLGAIDSLSSGSYSVTVLDSNGCETSEDFFINEPEPLELTIETTPVSCNGGSDGSADLDIIGGTPPYVISGELDSLSAGNYTITITDSLNCFLNTLFTIEEPDSIQAIVNITPSSCWNEPDGSVSFDITGGTPPYTIIGDTTGFYPTEFSGESYFVTIIDSLLCEKEVEFEMIGPDEISVILTSVFVTDCPNLLIDEDGNPGNIIIVDDLTAYGGTPPYNYTWSFEEEILADGPDETSLYVYEDGIYTLTITDSTNCQLVVDYEWEVGFIELETELITIPCFDDCNGSIVIPHPYDAPLDWVMFFASNDIDGDAIYDEDWNCIANCNIDQNNFNYESLLAMDSDIDEDGVLNGNDSDIDGDGVYNASGDCISNCNNEFTSSIYDTDLSPTAASLSNYTQLVPISIDSAYCNLDPFQDDLYNWEDDDMDGDGLLNTDPFEFDIDGDGVYDEDGNCIDNCNDYAVYDENGNCINFCEHNDPTPYGETCLIYEVNNLCPGEYYAVMSAPSFIFELDSIGQLSGDVSTDIDFIQFELDVLCESNFEFITIPSYEEILLEAIISTSTTGDAIACFGDSTGSIDIEVTGGVPDYSYSWNGPNGFTSQTDDISNLIAGTYNLVVTDSVDCFIDTTFVLTEPPQIILNTESEDLLCYGDSSAFINLFVEGGSPGYNFLWSGVIYDGTTFTSNDQSINSLFAGDYTVLVTDTNDCVESISVQITQPDSLSINPVLSEYLCGYNISCFGDTTGSIELDVSGGTPSYSFDWYVDLNGDGLFDDLNGDENIDALDVFSQNQNLFGLEAGIYSVFIEDDNNCIDSLINIELTQPDSLIVLPTISSTPACFADSTGSIDIEILGGCTLDGTYDISWSGIEYNGNSFSSSDQNISSLLAGVYSVEVCDDNGCCTQLDSLEVVQYPEIEISLIDSTSFINLFCFGDSTGIIDVDVIGGSGGYTYLWNTLDTTPSIDSLIAGTYTLDVVDSIGCVGFFEITINEPDAIEIVLDDLTPNGCDTIPSGSIEISVFGGTNPYNFSWIGPNEYESNQEDVFSLEQGIYELTITDSLGCVLDTVFDIIQLDAPIITIIDVVNIDCFNECTGSIEIDVEGVPEFSFDWLGPNGFVSNLEDITDLCAGEYILTVTDSTNCIAVDTITLIENPELIIETDSLFNSIACFGDSSGYISVNVTGGVPDYSYSWIGPGGFTSSDTFIEDLSGGNYTLIITDALDCETSEDFFIEEPQTLAVSGVCSDVTCQGFNDGAINLTITGGTPIYEYSWIGPGGFTSTNANINNLGPGVYSVTVTDANGCEETFSCEIFEPTEIDVTIDNVTNLSCFGSNDGSVEFSVVGGSGLFTYTLIDVGSGFDVTLINTIFPTSFNDLFAGPWVLNVVDFFGDCVYTYPDTIFILEPPILQVDYDFTENLCVNDCSGFIDMDVSGGTPPYEYELIDDSNNIIEINDTGFFDELCPECYTVNVLDSIAANGGPEECIESYQICINESDPVIEGEIIIDCDIDNEYSTSINTEVLGGIPDYTYTWTGPGGYTSNEDDISNLIDGTYTLSILDSIGCVDTLSFDIINPDPINIEIDSVQDLICYGDESAFISISVTGGVPDYSYSWTGPGGFTSQLDDISNLSPGTYTIQVQDAAGCVVLTEIVINESVPIEFDSDIDGDGEVNSSYEFSEYVCVDECTGSISFDINGGVSPYQFDIIDSSGGIVQSNNSGLFNGLCGDCYTVNILDAIQCITVFDFCIIQSEPIIESADLINLGCSSPEGGSATFDFSSGILPYNLNLNLNGALAQQELGVNFNNFTFSSLEPGQYEFVLEDDLGCLDSYEFEIIDQINVMDTVSIVVEDPECWNAPGFVDIEFNASYNIETNISFGNLSVYIDTDSNCNFDPIIDVLELSNINIVNSINSNGNLSISSSDIGPLDSGDYVFVIEDNFDCTLISCFSINTVLEPDPTMFFASVNASCTEASGSAYVSSDPLDIGGTPPYTIEWEDASGNPITTISPDALIASSLYAGDYVVTLTDSNGCEFSHPFTIDEPPSVLISGVSYSDSPCSGNTTNGTDDPYILIQPFGGQSGEYEIFITPNPNSGNCSNLSGAYGPIDLIDGTNPELYLTNICPGEYVIQISDGVCPEITETIIISEPSQEITWDIATAPLPCDDSIIDWSLEDNYYVYEGESPPPDLHWFTSIQNCNNINLEDAVDINFLGPDIYYLYSIDANGCCVEQEPHQILPVSQLESDFNYFDSDTWIECDGDNSGVIAFNTYGGTPPYTYIWTYDGTYIQDYDNFNYVDNLEPGLYEVVVNDSNGCREIIHSIEIEDAEPIENQVSVDIENLLCYNDSSGTISLELNDLLYEYNWSTYENLDDGSVNVIASGVDEIDNNFIVYWLNELGDTILIDDDLNNSSILDTLSVGLYGYIVSLNDDVNCDYQNLELLEVTQPDSLQITSIDSTNISCFGFSNGSIDLSVSGGNTPYIYTWQGPEGYSSNLQDISGLSAGLYTVVVTDQNGCGPIFDTINLIEPDEFIVDLSGNETSFTPTSCAYGTDNNGEIVINLTDLFGQISGGTVNAQGLYSNPILIDLDNNPYTGQVVNDEIIFSNLEAGEYFIYVSDFGSPEPCDYTSTDPIPIYPINDEYLDIDYYINPASCSLNGSLLIYDIDSQTWDPPYEITITSVADPDIVFNYSINDYTLSAGYNSDIDGDGILNQNDPDIDGDNILNSLDNDPYGGEISDPAFNEARYLLNQELPSGEYDIFISDGVGCESDNFSIYIPLESIPSVNISTIAGNCYSGLDQECDNLSINGAILIDPNSLPITTLYPYTISVSNNLIDEVFIIEEWPVLDNGDLGNYIIPNLDAGAAYSITITDANGCDYEHYLYEDNSLIDTYDNGSYYEIPFESELNIDITGFCPECQESNNGGFAYTFLTINDEIYSGISPDIDDITVGPLDNSNVDIFINGTNMNSCWYDIDGDGIINNEDDDMDGDGVLNDDDDDMDGDGILNDDDESINYPDFDNINSYDSNSFIPVQLDGDLQEELYYINSQWWNDIPDPNPLINYHQDYIQLLDDTTDYAIGGLSYGVYQVTIIDQETGCQFTEEIDISDETCKFELGSQQWDNCLFIPSVFTPNSDGFNDLWEIYNIELYEPGASVTIFDRWGQIVYKNDGDNYSSSLWDGVNLKGNSVEVATYYYVIEVEVPNTNPVKMKNYTGYVVVKR